MDIEETSTGDRRAGTAIAAAVAALVLVALVAIVLQREPATLDPGTPEGTVQAWLQSLADGDPRDDLVDLSSTCSSEPDVDHVDEPFRAVVAEVDRDGDRATVDLAITERFGDGPLDDGYTHDVRYELRRRDGDWVITDYDWPWHRCALGSRP